MAFDMIDEFRAATLPRTKLRSLARLAEIYAPQSREKEPANFLKRIWRPSRPVIHLAVAVRLLLGGWREKGQEIYVDDLVWLPVQVAWIIEEASRIEAFVTSDIRFRVTAADLMRPRVIK